MIQLQALKSENLEKANEAYLPPRRKGNSLACTAQLRWGQVLFALANQSGPQSLILKGQVLFALTNQTRSMKEIKISQTGFATFGK